MNDSVSTLLVVLQVVAWVLALLMFVGAQQARNRAGVGWWVVAFAIHAVSQLLRELASQSWGSAATLPIGHLGGTFGYAVLFVGVRRFLGLLPQTAFAVLVCLVATVLSIMSIAHGLNAVSLALTSCGTALFEALIAITFLRAWRRDRGLARAAAAATFALSGAASLTRAASVLLLHFQSSAIPASVVPTNEIWIIAFIAFNILQAGCLLFLLHQSLLDEMQSMADYDALTGLLNRGGMTRRIERDSARVGSINATPIGFLCMDLDGFKSINDNFGHGAGDDVLKLVGKVITDNSRPRDIAARQGGEEFALIVETGSEDEFRTLAERIRAAIGMAPMPTRAGLINVTASIGGALAAYSGESLDNLSERADRSLLEAKRLGKNCVVLAANPDL